MIACRKCGKEKNISDYSFRNKDKGIRHVQCKACIQEKIHQHYVNNREEYKTRVSEWVKNNKELRGKNFRNSYAKRKGYDQCECCSREELNEFLSKCPQGYHVDHIKTVRQKGKHCLKNIQYLPVSEHCRKSSYERYI